MLCFSLIPIPHPATPRKFIRIYKHNKRTQTMIQEFFVFIVSGLFIHIRRPCIAIFEPGGLTHMRSMCVGVAETGVEHRSLAKKHKETFLLSYFSVKKSTKSQQGGLTPSSFRTSCGVHELVAQVMRGKCVRQWIKQKSAVLPLSAISYYHACEHSARKSRADSCTHCLHAR